MSKKEQRSSESKSAYDILKDTSIKSIGRKKYEALKALGS